MVYSVRSYLWLSALLLLGSGCMAPRDLAWQPPRPLAADAPAYRPPKRPVLNVDADTGRVVAQLTFEEALRYTLQFNPELQAAAWEVRAREARTLQAGLWPNPELESEIDGVGAGAPGLDPQDREMSLMLTQELPLGGDPGAARRQALQEALLAGWNYEATRLELVARTQQAFVAVLAAQERLRLADSLLTLARRFEQAVQARVSAGKAPPFEARRAMVVRANAELAAQEAAQQLEAARRQLQSLWGTAGPRFQRVVGTLSPVDPVPPFDTLASLLTQHPALAQFTARRALRTAELQLARALRIPNLNVVAGLVRYGNTGTQAFRLGVRLPLPLFNRQQGNIQEARYRLLQTETEAEAVRQALIRRLAAAHARLLTSYQAVQQLQQEVLPAAREIFTVIEQGYREGKFDLLTVLDAQRTLLETTNQYLDALRDYHQARAEVEALIGQSLNTLLP